MRIIDLALKDLHQLVRDWKTALFLLIMPIGFTLLFGIGFGGTDAGTDPRLPAAVINGDSGPFGALLVDQLAGSEVIRLVEGGSEADLRRQVEDGVLAVLAIIPEDYSTALRSGEPYSIKAVVSESSSGFALQTAVQTAAGRLQHAATSAAIAAEASGDPQAFDAAFEKALAAWREPPVTTRVTQSSAAVDENQIENAYAHSSPGMLMQFAIAGLIGAAEIIVTERKTRTLQRLLTTAISRWGILLGHYLAMLVMIFTQVAVMVVFGQLFLELDYFAAPAATLLLGLSVAGCMAALGLLIGALSKTEELTIVLSLVPMFVFSALGGAWVPLEFTSETVQFVGHFSPVAWGMDGFKDILIRGSGLETVWLPALMLWVFGGIFFGLAVWRFRFE